MVWSKIDFEKEVRRQLIELRSLRKRVPEEQELVERIDRLEASHHSLLRKLNDLFATHTNAGEGNKESTQTSKQFSTSAVAPQGVGSSKLTATEVTLAVKNVRRELPPLEENCAACGRLLVTNLLAGDSAVHSDEGWYHSSCHGEGSGETGGSPLN